MPGVQPVAGTCNRSGGGHPPVPPVIQALVGVQANLGSIGNAGAPYITVQCLHAISCKGYTPDDFGITSIVRVLLLLWSPAPA